MGFNMRYEKLRQHEQNVFDNVDSEINKLLNEGRDNILKILCVKYGITN